MMHYRYQHRWPPHMLEDVGKGHLIVLQALAEQMVGQLLNQRMEENKSIPDLFDLIDIKTRR